MDGLWQVGCSSQPYPKGKRHRHCQVGRRRSRHSGRHTTAAFILRGQAQGPSNSRAGSPTSLHQSESFPDLTRPRHRFSHRQLFRQDNPAEFLFASIHQGTRPLVGGKLPALPLTLRKTRGTSVCQFVAGSEARGRAVAQSTYPADCWRLAVGGWRWDTRWVSEGRYHLFLVMVSLTPEHSVAPLPSRCPVTKSRQLPVRCKCPDPEAVCEIHGGSMMMASLGVSPPSGRKKPTSPRMLADKRQRGRLRGGYLSASQLRNGTWRALAKQAMPLAKIAKSP